MTPPIELMIKVGIVPSTDRHWQQVINIAFRNFWVLIDRATFRSDHRILDVGCGCGRLAATLAQKTKFSGIDVDLEHIEWCRSTYPGDFFHYDIKNLFYNPHGVKENIWPDLKTDSQDICHLASLFTHLPADDACKVLDESARVLCGDGKMVFSCFLQSGLKGGFGSRNILSDKIDVVTDLVTWGTNEENYFTVYNDEWFFGELEKRGFKILRFHPGIWGGFERESEFGLVDRFQDWCVATL